MLQPARALLGHPRRRRRAHLRRRHHFPVRLLPVSPFRCELRENPDRCRRLTARLEDEGSTTCTRTSAHHRPAWTSIVTTFANKGIKVRLPGRLLRSTPQPCKKPKLLRTWALRYSPRGCVLAGPRATAVSQSNTLSFATRPPIRTSSERRGTRRTLSSYTTPRPRLRVASGGCGSGAAGDRSGLLVQAEDAGSATSTWIKATWSRPGSRPRQLHGPALKRDPCRYHTNRLRPHRPHALVLSGLRGDVLGDPLLHHKMGPREQQRAHALQRLRLRDGPDPRWMPRPTTIRDVFARWRSSYGSRLAPAIIYHSIDLSPPRARRPIERCTSTSARRTRPERGACTNRAARSGRMNPDHDAEHRACRKDQYCEPDERDRLRSP